MLAGWPDPGDNGRVIALTEPQVWTLIAVFATIMVGTQTLLITGVRSQIGSLRTELKARFERDVQLLMNRESGENRG